MKLYSIIALVVGVFPHILAANNCDVLFLQSSSITFDLMERLEVDVNFVKKAVLPDAVLYYTTIPNGTTKIEISSVDYKVGLIVIPMLTNLPHSDENSTRIIETFCGDGKIAVVNFMNLNESLLGTHMIAMEKEIKDLSQSGINIIIAVIPNNYILTDEIINTDLINAVVRNTGDIWTKTRAVELLQNTENDPKALLISFDKNGDIIRSEENSINSGDVTAGYLKDRMRREGNETNSEKSGHEGNPGRGSGIFFAGQMKYRDCLAGECSLGNFIADTFAFYARWHLTNDRKLWSRYPVAFFHDTDEPLRGIELERGYYSMDAFIEPFGSITQRVCVCDAEAKEMGNVLMRMKKPMRLIHMSGAYLWRTPDSKKKVATIRNKDASDPGFVKVVRGKYGAIGSEKVLREMRCRPNCNAIKDDVQGIVREYVRVHKNIIPQAEFRYWTISWDDFYELEHGYGRAYMKSTAFATGVNLKVLTIVALYLLRNMN